MDQRLDLARHSRSTSSTARLQSPQQAVANLVPADNGFGPYDDELRTPIGEPTRDRNPEQAIPEAKLRSRRLAMESVKLLAQSQILADEDGATDE